MTETATPTGTAPGPTSTGGAPRRLLTTVLIAVIAVGLLVAGGGLAVALGIGRTDPPAGDSVDAGFARDMSLHHLQAVEMANVAQAATTDDEVRQLAFDISSTQNNQVGRMRGWLSLWGLPLSGGEVMAWMGGTDGTAGGHAAHDMSDAATADGALMPGMATESELADLRTLTGRALDVRFLQLMIRHHQGGAEMARYAATHADRDAVRSLARSIADTQEAETTTMEQMLRSRGGSPLPAP